MSCVNTLKLLTINLFMLETLLNPMNWSMTYGPYELHNWEEYLSFCQQLCAGTAFNTGASVPDTDADDYMSYESIEVI